MAGDECHLLRCQFNLRPFSAFILPLGVLAGSFPFLDLSDRPSLGFWYVWFSSFCVICFLSWKDTVIQSSTRPQLWGLYRLSIEHICSPGQLRQGADSIHSILIGRLIGRSLYVHLPFSKNLTLLISERFSREAASREPSLLLSSRSFQSLDWTMPPFPLSVIILRPLPARSSISVQFPVNESTSNITIKQLPHNYSFCSRP